MKAHLWRWAKRVFFGLIVVVGVFTALYLIAATLFSNMNHNDKISLYIIIGYALCCYLRGRWRTFFATKPANASTEKAHAAAAATAVDVEPEPEPEVIVRAPMTDEAAVISSDALASLTSAKKESVWL